MKTLLTVLPAALNRIRQGSTMLSIKGYVNNFHELSSFGIVFHVNYNKAVQKSVDIWRAYRPLNAIEARVKEDLLDSYTQSLKGYNPRALSAGAYCNITDGAHLIKSIKWHENGKACHFWGFRVHKRIIRPGIYPVDTQSEWVIHRNHLMSLAPISRFRQFKISEGRFDRIGVEHLTLTEHDLLRSIEDLQ